MFNMITFHNSQPANETRRVLFKFLLNLASHGTMMNDALHFFRLWFAEVLRGAVTRAGWAGCVGSAVDLFLFAIFLVYLLPDKTC